jgi:predicted O-methyltransferase YrrM
MTQLDYFQRWTMQGGSLHRFERITDFDYYQKIPGWFDFEGIYDLAIAEAQDGATFVEIGCWFGRSTAYLASRAAMAKKKVTIYAVDPWVGWIRGAPENVFVYFLDGMAQAGVIDIVVPLRMMSNRAVKLFNDQSVDFCFLDGDHTYEAVSEDVRNWFPKIRPGGILAGHDYASDEHVGVKRAVDEFFRDPVTAINGSWGVRKVG